MLTVTLSPNASPDPADTHADRLYGMLRGYRLLLVLFTDLV